MIKGFRDFILRGNLIELAVAFIMGTAFAAVVSTFAALILDVIGKIFSVPDFSKTSIGGFNVGPFLAAVVSFVLVALILYVALVTPFNKFKELQKKRMGVEEDTAAAPTSEELLSEIRDLLAAQNGGSRQL